MEPFAPPIRPEHERANRLMAVKSMPGFSEIIRISQQMRDEATAILVDWGGWDKDQLAVLKARAQAAKEFHAGLFKRIDEAIGAGLEEAAKTPSPSPREVIEQSDRVRAEVLATGEETGKLESDDNRVAGSY